MGVCKERACVEEVEYINVAQDSRFVLQLLLLVLIYRYNFKPFETRALLQPRDFSNNCTKYNFKVTGVNTR